MLGSVAVANTAVVVVAAVDVVVAYATRAAPATFVVVVGVVVATVPLLALPTFVFCD